MTADVARRIIPLVDLTTLTGSETEADIVAMCEKGQTEAGGVAGICTYRQWIPVMRRELEGTGIRVVSVANFPSGALDAELTVRELKEGVEAGADEIDIVFPWESWLAGDHAGAIAVVEAARAACPVTLKVIIESGKLGDQVGPVSEAVIKAGTDFVKTSTGKVEPAATLEAARVILETVRDSDAEVGFKASGGIRTTEEATQYLMLADEIVGPEWAKPQTFRIGASSLLDDLLKQLGYGSAAATPTSNY